MEPLTITTTWREEYVKLWCRIIQPKCGKNQIDRIFYYYRHIIKKSLGDAVEAEHQIERLIMSYGLEKCIAYRKEFRTLEIDNMRIYSKDGKYYHVEGEYYFKPLVKVLAFFMYKNAELVLTVNKQYEISLQKLLGLCCLQMPILYDMLQDGEL